MRPMLCALVVASLAAGCGGGRGGVEQVPATTAPRPATTAPTTTTATTTAPTTTARAPTTTAPTTTAATPARPMTLELFFLAPDGRLVAASRTVEHTQTPGAATLRELADPPAGATTQVPRGLQLRIDGRRAQVSGATLDGAALAQVVYSLTSFPTVRSVNGKTRADVESFAPAILVERPAPHEAVTSPFRVTGTANAFEATFNYKLKDADGKVLAHDFVTASSGSGTRGTFTFTVRFSVDSPQEGTLDVFELSAENGSVIHERVLPLRLVP